jgi:predicted nucleic acid-binding protein
MSVLVDTSVWIDFLRNRKVAHVDALSRLLESGRVCLAAPILQEILQGAGAREHLALLRKQFGKLPVFGFADAIEGAIAAARLYIECRLAGKTPRSSNDCLIACIAMENDLELFHNDRDFDVIAKADPRLRVRVAA